MRASHQHHHHPPAGVAASSGHRSARRKRHRKHAPIESFKYADTSFLGEGTVSGFLSTSGDMPTTESRLAKRLLGDPDRPNPCR